MSFALDPRLDGDTVPVGDLTLCRVLLMREARLDWLILVPRRAGLVEISDLDAPARALLMEEMMAASAVLARCNPGAKINIGALGNIVRQLHIHVLARREGDHAWPGPIWGAERDPGEQETLVRRAGLLSAEFGL
ncbi:MAG: HIT domain-containing protein [Hyphomicrobiaceae bacterium]|nr:HIT domain-containing protein [Hyphomicrobiaceae bacterium]